MVQQRHQQQQPTMKNRSNNKEIKLTINQTKKEANGLNKHNKRQKQRAAPLSTINEINKGRKQEEERRYIVDNQPKGIKLHGQGATEMNERSRCIDSAVSK
jgi:hypothetical protein